MEKHLHIVCLDTPYPVDYGGVFDLFYKLVALHSAGIKIHLHCFEYGRGEQPELNKYCEEVHYYKRQQGHKGFSHKLPYIVASRINENLYKRLLENDFPILLEGVHCTHLLNDSRFAKRKIFLRLHNVEFRYYRELARTTKNIIRKFYYLHESRLLKRYEKSIANKAILIPVTEQDGSFYRTQFGAKRVMHLPVFLPFADVNAQTGIGCFCLYHGNLSVAENEKAARWLLKEVFNDLHVPLVIAGKNPSATLEKIAAAVPKTCIVANPSWEEMQDMIGKAQINIVPSFNSTGIKLKLLNVLYNGRHCVVNEATVDGSGLSPACHVGSNANGMKSLVTQLYHQPFNDEEIVLRKNLLHGQYNNEINAKRLITWIW
ncbi:MAG: glycosyltransferase [Chitinophagaceae bacterium]|nr:glycosyltransferase [Chitinophagaceae bacterium]